MQYQYYTLSKGTVHNQQHKGIVQLLTDRVYTDVYINYNSQLWYYKQQTAKRRCFGNIWLSD